MGREPTAFFFPFDKVSLLLLALACKISCIGSDLNIFVFLRDMSAGTTHMLGTGEIAAMMLI